MKTIRLFAWLFPGMVLFAAASGCQEKETIIYDPGPQLVHVRYAQTQCADRWGQAAGAQQLISTAQAYLAQRNLLLYQPQTTTGAAQVCNACTCTTGLILEGDVAPGDLSAVLALGFTQ